MEYTVIVKAEIPTEDEREAISLMEEAWTNCEISYEIEDLEKNE